MRGDQPKLSSTPTNDSASQLMVQDLMVHGKKGWDSYFIHAMFSKAQAAQVLSTPLLISVSQDTCIWRHSVHGEYTVRTIYHVYMSQVANSHLLHVEGLWSLIWKLAVPLKVKVFLWKACRSCLPTRVRLQDKGVQCPATCILCSIELEQAWHLFFPCELNVPCW